ncbi:uncharacterized protein LOC117104481 [Anneissia japonica]|uniref:uncharacterized protein LOC117104481 n=1 Tax=Anneissia japonica TaxID=1529436 RepID=UPI0014254B94|nr:uncharacterized protein LOC117104481 [Anneissia japonica]
MIHTPKVSTDDEVIMQKMKNTFPLRQEMIGRQDSATSIIRSFPRFLNTPGLIEQDFRLLFPDHHTNFLEKWPNVKDQVVSFAREINGSIITSQLLTAVDRDPEGDGLYGDWDPDTAAILLLLCLLPPVNQGRGKSQKMSITTAIDEIIQFEKIGTSVEEFLECGQHKLMQPYLLAIASFE